MATATETKNAIRGGEFLIRETQAHEIFIPEDFNEEQKMIAEKVMHEVQKQYHDPVVTQFALAGPFYEAEPEHQKFTERTGRGMCHVPYEAI